MITRIEVLGYRCLQYVNAPIRPFSVLVGPNASGKTSFIDAVVLLRDVLEDGVAVAIRNRAEEFEDLTWMRSGNFFELALDLALPKRVRTNGYEACRYALRIGRDHEGQVGILEETLWLLPTPSDHALEPRQLFPAPLRPPKTLLKDAPRGAKWRVVLRKVADSGNDYFRSETGGWNIQFRVGRARPALAGLPEDESRFPASVWLKRYLTDGVQNLSLNSVAMRASVSPRSARKFEPDGSNVPLVLEDLKRDQPTRYEEWVRHLRTIIPDLDGVDVAVRESDRHRYIVLSYRSGLRAPSWLVSDGTLRMLVLTLVAYIESRDRIFMIEEPENGLHPQALEPVFESLSSVYEGQVMVASHNILLLGLATPAETLVFAKTPEGASDIVPGDMHPALLEWRGDTDLGTLVAAGVLD